MRQLRRNPRFYVFQRRSSCIARDAQQQAALYDVLEDATASYVRRAAISASKTRIVLRMCEQIDAHEAMVRAVQYASTRWGTLQRALQSELDGPLSFSSSESSGSEQ